MANNNINKNSKTYKNLQTAFAGEASACLKYNFYASKAKKEGYAHVSSIFTETANNEKEHAEIWFKLLHNANIPTTTNNLQDAIDGEKYEWSDMYEHMANDAKAEGYDYVAELFLGIAAIEKNHQQRYESYLNLINSKNMFTSSSDGTVWFCTNCGHLHTAKNAPKVCPICSHPQDYFVKSTLKVTE